MFSIGRVLDLLVPDIPESVQIKVKREYYLAKQALAENEVSPTHTPHAPIVEWPQPSTCCQAGWGAVSLITLSSTTPPGHRLSWGRMEPRTRTTSQPSASEESLGHSLSNQKPAGPRQSLPSEVTGILLGAAGPDVRPTWSAEASHPGEATPLEYPKPGDYSRGTWWAGTCLHHLPLSPTSRYLLTLPGGRMAPPLRLPPPVTPIHL